MGFNDFLNRAASVARGALFEDEAPENTEAVFRLNSSKAVRSKEAWQRQLKTC